MLLDMSDVYHCMLSRYVPALLLPRISTTSFHGVQGLEGLALSKSETRPSDKRPWSMAQLAAISPICLSLRT